MPNQKSQSRRFQIAYNRALFSSKTKGPGEQGAAGYCPKILLLKGPFFHRSHREICTRNRPVPETKFLDDFCEPLSLPAPLFTAELWNRRAPPKSHPNRLEVYWQRGWMVDNATEIAMIQSLRFQLASRKIFHYHPDYKIIPWNHYFCNILSSFSS